MASTAALVADQSDAIPITALTRAAYDGWLQAQPAPRRAWVAASGFRAQVGGFCLLPGEDGKLAEVWHVEHLLQMMMQLGAMGGSK